MQTHNRLLFSIKVASDGNVNVTFEDLVVQIRNQISPAMSPNLWCTLPNEIVDEVLECVLPFSLLTSQKRGSKAVKHAFSNLSLVG